jgi:hypothetical protein
MSCILYNKASYDKLGANLLFDEICRDLYDVKTGEAMAAILWKLNCEAYECRYGHHESVGDEILESELDPNGDEFKESLDNRYSTLWKLISRIDYQIADHPRYRDKNFAPVQTLESLQHVIARKMADHYEKVEVPHYAPNTISLLQLARQTRANGKVK